MEYWTTQEVAKMENVTAPIAQRFAKEHKVKRLSDRYFWTKKDLEAFKKRKKTKGRPFIKDGKKDLQMDLF